MSHPRPLRLPLRRPLLLGLACLLLSSGCATTKAPPPRPAGVFFPAAPDLPRVQFLTSYSGRKDVESQSQFNKFVVGEQADVKLDKPYGVAIWDGKIYVCDTNSTVVVFDLTKHSFHALAGATGQGQLLGPVNISVEADGTKYVSDPARGQVVVFGREDQYLRAYGTPGNWRPVDAVAFGDRLYVADGAKASVRVLDKASGEEIKRIGAQGEASERLSLPTNLAFDRAGYLYVSDVGRFQVLVYDRDGHFQRLVGKLGDNLAHFARPKGIAVDREGRLLAADASFANVQVFDRTGQLLMFFGGPGAEPGLLELPAKVVIDYDNLKYFQPYAASGFELDYVTLVVSQFGPRLVNVYGTGRQKGQKYPSDEELRQQIAERRKQALEALRSQAPAPSETPAAPSPTPSSTPGATSSPAPDPTPTPAPNQGTPPPPAP